MASPALAQPSSPLLGCPGAGQSWPESLSLDIPGGPKAIRTPSSSKLAESIFASVASMAIVDVNGAGEFDFAEMFASSTPKHEGGGDEEYGAPQRAQSLASLGEGDAAWVPPPLPSPILLPARPGSPEHLLQRSHSLVGPSLPLVDRGRTMEGSLGVAGKSELRWQVVGTGPDVAGISAEGQPVMMAGDVQLEVDVVEVVKLGGSECSGGSDGELLSPLAAAAAVSVSDKRKICPADFDLLRVVGQGAFGKVFQVREKASGEIMAMKVMRKDRIMEKNHGCYMRAERDILTGIVHPFIVNLRYSFQTKSKLYLLLDFINGGHLFFQLYRQGTFGEDLTRFYAAEVFLALEHLHKADIMHRDLKPENILLDSEGHLKLTDFGLAKANIISNSGTNSMCGTMEYMAPEILLAQGHGKPADWWSLGILMYEMMTGEPPFFCNNRQKLQNKIIKDKLKMPPYLSSTAHSILKGLLNKDPAKRLGSGPGASDEIKKHAFFKGVNWRKLEAKEVVPPFRPAVAGQLCTANFDEMWTKLPPQDSPASTPRGEVDFFQGYSYVAPNVWGYCTEK